MDIAGALKAEILRLAKKVIKQELEPLRSGYATQRKQIAELKLQVVTLEKQLKRTQKSVSSAPAASAVDGGGVKSRFSAKMLRGRRLKLGLSQAQYATLFGVSAQTIYNWESGNGRPNAESLAVFGQIRKIGKREAMARLSEPESAA